MVTSTLQSNGGTALEHAIGQVDDFPEWVAPIVVRELRQGLRSVFFVLPFAVLPALLAVAAGWALAQGNLTISRRATGTFFWLALVIPVLVVTPLRALPALHRERADGSLDLLRLTALSGWGIVTGKWCSLLSQAGLWLFALLPFFVLRYFFGAMNVTGELLLIAWIFILGAALTALNLFLSTFRPGLARVLAVVLPGFLGVFIIGPILGLLTNIILRGSGTGAGAVFAQVFLLFLIAGAVLFALALTVSRVCPPPAGVAPSHATPAPASSAPPS